MLLMNECDLLLGIKQLGMQQNSPVTGNGNVVGNIGAIAHT